MTSFFLLISSLIISLELFKYLDVLKNIKKYKKITNLIIKVFKNKRKNLDTVQKRIININKLFFINSFILIIQILFIFFPQILLSIFNSEFYLFLISLNGVLVSLVFSILYIKLRF